MNTQPPKGRVPPKPPAEPPHVHPAARIEPGLEGDTPEDVSAAATGLSMAISLKRLADVVAPLPLSGASRAAAVAAIGTTPHHEGATPEDGEAVLAALEAAGFNIVRAMKGL